MSTRLSLKSAGLWINLTPSHMVIRMLFIYLLAISINSGVLVTTLYFLVCPWSCNVLSHFLHC